MSENRLGVVFAGIIVGGMCGILFYAMPAKCLITGPMKVDGLFIDWDLNQKIIQVTLWRGGIAGMIVGLIAGLSKPDGQAPGEMSKSISAMLFLVVTILAFINFGENLAYMAWWKIFVTFSYVFFAMCLAVPLGHFLGGIERMGEG